MKRIKLLLIACLMIVGCTTHPSHYNTALDDIHAALQSSKNADQNIANRYPRAGRQPPSAVTNALLPNASFNLPTGNNPELEPRFNISAKDLPAKAFFMGLVQGTHYNMVVSPNITGTVSLTLKNITVSEAMDAARDMYGYEYRRTPYGFEVLPQTLQTQLFKVNYLDVIRTGRSLTTISSSQISDKVGTTGSNSSSGSSSGGNTTNQQASGSQVDTHSEVDFWKSLDESLKGMVGNQEGHSVVINPGAGVVIVRAYPQELANVAHYLDAIQNNMDRQVVIEAKILEVQLNNQFQSGIDWNILGLKQSGSDVSVLPDAFPAGMASLSVSSGNTFNMLINLLEQQGNVQVLSSPRVSTINNQKAVIKVGQDNFYVTGITSNVTPSSGSSSTSSSVNLTPFFAGITLDVTPEISDAGDIILQIHPSVSTVSQENQTIDLGTQGKLHLPLAQSTIRESDSIVRAHSGQVVIIGGLMQNNTSEKISATPGLSRIPFLGALFRDTNQLSKRSELVILLRPVLASNKTWPNALQESDARFQVLNRGFHAGASPEIFGTMGEKFSQ